MFLALNIVRVGMISQQLAFLPFMLYRSSTRVAVIVIYRNSMVFSLVDILITVFGVIETLAQVPAIIDTLIYVFVFRIDTRTKTLLLLLLIIFSIYLVYFPLLFL